MERQTQEGTPPVVQILATTSAREESPEPIQESAEEYVSKMVMDYDDTVNIFLGQKLYAKDPTSWSNQSYVPTSTERCGSCKSCVVNTCRNTEAMEMVCLNCLEKKACIIKASHGCELWPEHLSHNYLTTMRIANTSYKEKYQQHFNLIQADNIDALFIMKKDLEKPPPYGHNVSEGGGASAPPYGHNVSEGGGASAPLYGHSVSEGGGTRAKMGQPINTDKGQAICDDSCQGACEASCRELCGDQCVAKCVRACMAQHRTGGGKDDSITQNLFSKNQHFKTPQTQTSDQNKTHLDDAMEMLKKMMQVQMQMQMQMKNQQQDYSNFAKGFQQKLTVLENKMTGEGGKSTGVGIATGGGGVHMGNAHSEGHKLPDMGEGQGEDQIGRLASALEKNLLQNQKPTPRMPQITLPQMTKLSNSTVSATSYFGWKRKILTLMKDNNLADSLICNLIQNDQNLPRRFRNSIQNCSTTDSIFAIFATMCDPLESVYPQLLQTLTSLPACHDSESQIKGLDTILMSIAEIENYFDDKDLTVSELTAVFAALCTSEQLNSLPATISHFKDRHEREGIKYIKMLKEYSLKRRADLYNIRSAIQIYRPGDQLPHNTLVQGEGGGASGRGGRRGQRGAFRGGRGG